MERSVLSLHTSFWVKEGRTRRRKGNKKELRRMRNVGDDLPSTVDGEVSSLLS
jgi:hypothetical protein